MNPLLQCVEVGGSIDNHHDLSVDDRAFGELVEGGAQLREVSEQWALVAGIDPVLRFRPGE